MSINKLGILKKKWNWLYISVFLLLMFTYFLLCSWNFNASEYPNAETSPFVLPIKSGTKTFCMQGNNTNCTHRNKFKYSFDFLLPIGTKIYAAREGIVTDVLNSVNKIGWHDGNFVAITHDDGTTAIYAHLKHNGATVQTGDFIRQKELIGYSGMTGKSIYPHLHFHVEKANHAVPVSFSNMKEDNGIPKFLHTYKAK